MNDHRGPAGASRSQPATEAAASTDDDAGEGLTAEIAAKIETFVPLSLRGEDPGLLGVVMPAARHHVTKAGPGDPHEARRFVRAVAELLVERVRGGEPLDPEIDLHPDSIDYFVNTACADDSRGVRHERQWALTLIGRAVVPHLHPVKRKGVGKRAPVDGYAPQAEGALLLAAGLRCDLGWPGDAWVALAVLGFGMKGPEARMAHPGDLFPMRGGRLGVQVRGRHPRRVPIRKPYMDLAHAVLRAAGDGPFITCGDLHKIAARVAVHGGPCLSMVRGRNTWITAHLMAGTPLAALRRIAGPVSMETFTHLLGAAAAEITDDEALSEGLRA